VGRDISWNDDDMLRREGDEAGASTAIEGSALPLRDIQRVWARGLRRTRFKNGFVSKEDNPVSLCREGSRQIALAGRAERLDHPERFSRSRGGSTCQNANIVQEQHREGSQYDATGLGGLSSSP